MIHRSIIASAERTLEALTIELYSWEQDTS